MSDMTFTLVFILICLLIDGYRERKEMKWSDDMADRDMQKGDVAMADRITVMSWLEGLAEPDWRVFHSDSEVQNIATSALALLKDQEKQKFFVDENGKITPLPVVVRCKDCKHRGNSEKCVLSAISEEKDFPLFMLDNRGEWFCADGER